MREGESERMRDCLLLSYAWPPGKRQRRKEGKRKTVSGLCVCVCVYFTPGRRYSFYQDQMCLVIVVPMTYDAVYSVFKLDFRVTFLHVIYL